MDIPGIDQTVIDSIRQAATNIEETLSSGGLNPVISLDIGTMDDLEDGDDMFVAVASVSSSAPPVPKDKTGVRHLEELHILFAVHRNYPRVLVYAKNTNGLNPSGWIQVKTLMPHQATADALTAAADMALSYARKYEQVHEQT